MATRGGSSAVFFAEASYLIAAQYLITHDDGERNLGAYGRAQRFLQRHAGDLADGAHPFRLVSSPMIL